MKEVVEDRFCFVTLQIAVAFLLERARESRQHLSMLSLTQTSSSHSSKSSLRHLMDPMRSTMIRHRDTKQSMMRRGSIVYDPQCMLYHPRSQLPNTDVSPVHSPSVFSQILIKDYIETSPLDEESVTEGKYWWSIKRISRKKYVLPWNHPLTTSKPHSPRYPKGSPIGTPQKGSATEFSFEETETLLEPRVSTKRRNRLCCCILRQKEEETEQAEDISSLDAPQIQEVNIRKREGDLSLGTVEARGGRTPLSEDRAMGSFIEDLRRSQAHSISSLSWKTDSSVH